MKKPEIIRHAALNAFLAAAYISLLVASIALMESRLNRMFDNYMGPVLMLMLLTLSVAVMGMLFFGRPAMLYADGKKRESVQMLLATIGSFALIIFAVVAVVALLNV